jgi:hypothetical protein
MLRVQRTQHLLLYGGKNLGRGSLVGGVLFGGTFALAGSNGLAYAVRDVEHKLADLLCDVRVFHHRIFSPRARIFLPYPTYQTVMASEVEPPFVSAAENKGWLHSAPEQLLAYRM